MAARLAAGEVQVQPNPVEEGVFSAQSHSGQFLVQADRLQLGKAALSPYATNSEYVRLDPMLLPVSCERIKQVVWTGVGAGGQWQGKILVFIRPALSLEDTVLVESAAFTDRWRYRVVFPEILPRVRFVRAVVSVVLSEMANRVPGRKGAEVPTWLVEGMTQHVLSSSEISVVLPPPILNTNRVGVVPVLLDQRRPLVLARAHQVLSGGEVMTFDEMSWQAVLPPGKDERLRCNAQVFIHGLSRLPGGQAGLLRFIEGLSGYHNWQFAFFEAFSTSFSRPLEVEKWWALEVRQFLNRDIGQTWSEELTRQRLEEALRSEVVVYSGTNQNPTEMDLSLETVLAEWEPAQQVPVLQKKLVSLAHIRVRAAPSVALVVDEYQNILREYLAIADIGDKEWTRRRKLAQVEASKVARARLADLTSRIKATSPNANPALGAQMEALRVNSTNAPALQFRE